VDDDQYCHQIFSTSNETEAKEKYAQSSHTNIMLWHDGIVNEMKGEREPKVSCVYSALRDQDKARLRD
jgi:hypothetical protein